MTYRLCYIDSHAGPIKRAYFTNLEPFTEQTGDDWEDAQYWLNASPPYDSGDNLKIVVFESQLLDPHDYPKNLSMSVDQINDKQVPWLINGDSQEPDKQIYAGCPLEKFKCDIWAAGGTIFEPKSSPAGYSTKETVELHIAQHTGFVLSDDPDEPNVFFGHPDSTKSLLCWYLYTLPHRLPTVFAKMRSFVEENKEKLREEMGKHPGLIKFKVKA